MPSKPPRPCHHSRCPELTCDPSGYCVHHKQEAQRYHDGDRGSASERGYDACWERYRKRYLSENPLCILCLKEGRTTPTVVVDHIVPHRGDTTLFWDPNNHQALCKPCHSAKTAREDGGFGNPIQQHTNSANDFNTSALTADR